LPSGEEFEPTHAAQRGVRVGREVADEIGLDREHVGGVADATTEHQRQKGMARVREVLPHQADGKPGRRTQADARVERDVLDDRLALETVGRDAGGQDVAATGIPVLTQVDVAAGDADQELV
jgi:hypothetical protein